MLLNKYIKLLSLLFLVSINYLWAGDDLEFGYDFGYLNTCNEYETDLNSNDPLPNTQLIQNIQNNFIYNIVIENQTESNSNNNIEFLDQKDTYLVNEGFWVERVSEPIQGMDQFKRKKKKRKLNGYPDNEIKYSINIATWKLKIALVIPQTMKINDLPAIDFNVVITPIRLSRGNIKYNSFAELVKEDLSHNTFLENFSSDIDNKTITWEQLIQATVSLSCSRCYSLQGKGKQELSVSPPIYMAIMLVYKKRIYASRLIWVEPILKKTLEKLGSLKIPCPHEENISLFFEDPFYANDPNLPTCPYDLCHGNFRFSPIRGCVGEFFYLILPDLDELSSMMEKKFSILFGKNEATEILPFGSAIQGTIPEDFFQDKIVSVTILIDNYSIILLEKFEFLPKQ